MAKVITLDSLRADIAEAHAILDAAGIPTHHNGKPLTLAQHCEAAADMVASYRAQTRAAINGRREEVATLEENVYRVRAERDMYAALYHDVAAILQALEASV